LRQEVDPHAIHATVAAATSLGRLDMLRLWIEAQSTPIIALVVFGLSYLGTALIFVLVTSAAPYGWARDFKFVPAVALTPLAILLAVLLGFLASRVWTNFDHAEGYVRQEADALHQTLLMAQALPPTIQTRLRNAISAHVKAVEEEEWPAMARQQQANLARSPGVLTEAIVMLLEFSSTRTGEQVAQERAVAALEQALEARRSRIMLSGVLIDWLQWWVVVLLIVLVLVMIAMSHIDNRGVCALSLFFVATALAASLLLLMAYDQPFNAGGFFLRPTLLKEIVAN
jgi:ABC-type multidrug transport system fused ATPase/permease subunit